MLTQLAAADGKPHFYIASGGNAGLACVHAAVTLGLAATVAVPESATAHTIQKLRDAGASDVVQAGASWQESNAHLTDVVMEEARKRGETVVYVPPFDHPAVWDGNAGITREIAAQFAAMTTHYPGSGGSVDAIVCSVGGGGLFSGMMQGRDETGLAGRVVTVETHGADSLAQAVEKGELVTLPAITSLATSLGARRVCARALQYALRDDVTSVVVSDEEGMRAAKRFLNEDRMLVELACAVCPALCYSGKIRELVDGFHEGSNVVLVICGGSNISTEVLEKY